MNYSINAPFLQSLSAPQLLYFLFAVIASAFLVLQFILMFVPAFILISEEKTSFFSAKSITPFLAFGGWGGYISSLFIDNVWLPLLVALAAGAAGMLLVFQLTKLLLKAQRSFLKNRFTGADAVVSQTVPPMKRQKGKIYMLTGERAERVDAITEEEQAIPAGTPVKVLSVSDGCALVCRIEKTKIGSSEPVLPQEIPTNTGVNSN